jgi:hypothetical protein
MRSVLGALRNPRQITSSDHWIIRDQLVHLGSYFVSAFLDDLIGMAVGSFATNLLCSAVLQCFERLAIQFHVHKCSLRATAKLNHLGFLLDVSEHKFYLSDK